MSAVLVLILRALMTISLYAFLLMALYIMWKSINQTVKEKNLGDIPPIQFELDDHPHLITFNQLEIFIGRDPQNDFEIDDETVSGRHARIFYKNNQWFIEDLQSTNGTFLNGEKIVTTTILVPQDAVKIGSKLIKIDFPSN